MIFVYILAFWFYFAKTKGKTLKTCVFLLCVCAFSDILASFGVEIKSPIDYLITTFGGV